MNSLDLDEIKSQLNALSTPVGRCVFCDIPVYAIAPSQDPICLQCWCYKLEYDRMVKNE